MNNCLLVLGMHGSGTSAVTGALNILGVELGAQVIATRPECPKGVFENRSAAMDKRLLTDIASQHAYSQRNQHHTTISEDERSIAVEEQTIAPPARAIEDRASSMADLALEQAVLQEDHATQAAALASMEADCKEAWCTASQLDTQLRTLKTRCHGALT